MNRCHFSILLLYFTLFCIIYKREANKEVCIVAVEPLSFVVLLQWAYFYSKTTISLRSWLIPSHELLQGNKTFPYETIHKTSFLHILCGPYILISSVTIKYTQNTTSRYSLVCNAICFISSFTKKSYLEKVESRVGKVVTVKM